MECGEKGESVSVEMRCVKCVVMVVVLLMAGGRADAEEKPADTRVGFANMETLFQQYWKTMRAERRVRKQTEIWRAQLREMIAERDRIHDEYIQLRDQSTDLIFSEGVRTKKRQAAATKFREYSAQKGDIDAYRDAKQKQANNEFLKTRAAMVSEIAAAVQKLAEAEGYITILDSSGETFNNLPVFVYHKPELDLTERLLAIINAGHEDNVTEELKRRDEEKTISADTVEGG